MTSRRAAAALMKAMAQQKVRYATTKLGGGVTGQGISFPGGLDLTTPSLALNPGSLRDVLNFECSPSGGYSRVQGYERFDGRPAPSKASYSILQFAAFTTVPTAGQALTQSSSGATATVAAVVTGNTPYLAITMVTGTFDFVGQVTTPGPVVVGVPVMTNVTVSSQQDAQYTANAADIYRALIGAVPGSGPVLGVVGMIFSGLDNVYAFRANNAGTAVLLYKASSSGWKNVPFFNLVNFTQGSALPNDGDTLTQGGVTATIMRVMWRSGTTGATTAAGGLVVTNPSGGNFAAGAATSSSGGVFVLSGAQAPITLAVGGNHFEFSKYNFAGQLVTRRIYGCDGVNQCFEFDGTTLAPISTGAVPDIPSHLTCHKNFLIVAQGSSIFYCGVGTPFKWSSVDGGGEIATGDIVTSMITLPGSQTTATLAIFLRSNTSFLYGTDQTTFNFVVFNTGQGCLPYAAQNLFDTFVFDDLGVITLRTTLNWGNFLPTTLTKNILPLIIQERTKLIASSVQRTKSQYRVFFSDGYGLWLTMINQQYLGIGLVLFPNPVFCCDEGETSTGVEVSYFGSSDGLGYVYQLDTGTSFDGANIDAFCTLAWDPIKSPRIIKHFRAASVEMQGTGYAAISFGYQLGYAIDPTMQPSPANYSSSFRPAPNWDQFVWDNFFWDGRTLAPTDVDMPGDGENVQVTLASSTNYIPAYTLNSIIYHYSMRRGIRVG